MLRTALLIAAISGPGAVQAAELWCMPDTLCNKTACKPTTDEEMSVRLQDLTDETTTLRSQGEDVPMTRSESGDITQWQGVNAFGGREILAWRQSDGAFTYLVRWDDGESRASGRCEVQ